MTDHDSNSGPTVSVIVPAHNAATYLDECLDSVLGQTLRHIEVIVVDDASGDATPEILASRRDERLRVITHRTNGGVSAARNTGLRAASGRLVAFVDADDYIAPTMYAELVAAANDLDVDVVSCGISAVDPAGMILVTEDFPLTAEIRYDATATREALHGAFAAKMLWYPVRSLYSRELVERHALRFDEGIRKGEDSLFNLEALFHARATACIRSAPYRYRKHPASATAKPLASESDNLERLGQQVVAFYRAHDFDDRAYDDFYRQVLRSDLPTAFVRLRRHPKLYSEIRAMLDTDTVRAALRSQSIRRLGAPRSVVILLALAKYAPPAVLASLLRLRR